MVVPELAGAPRGLSCWYPRLPAPVGFASKPAARRSDWHKREGSGECIPGEIPLAPTYTQNSPKLLGVTSNRATSGSSAGQADSCPAATGGRRGQWQRCSRPCFGGFFSTSE